MSVLIFTETEGGKFKKNAFETASYGSAVAKKMGVESVAIAINSSQSDSLGKFGISKVLEVHADTIQLSNAALVANIIQQGALTCKASVIIVSSSSNAKFMAPILAGNLGASYIPNAVELPESTSPITVKRSVFSNKGFAHSQAVTSTVVIGLSSNAFGSTEVDGTATLEAFTPDLSGAFSESKVISTDKASDKISIADADVVVSGGRGLKGPENWGMIEDLATVLGAATACSKPVSDMGWRPHGEHVGQTGKPVASNLYIAIGISGAIQHLAGVNSSKVKVVINNDPEAPFFKAADYGVVGDAFQVVPELIEKLKRFKEENA
jgi:electron transfer flavoprotein alpha subunit